MRANLTLTGTADNPKEPVILEGWPTLPRGGLQPEVREDQP